MLWNCEPVSCPNMPRSGRLAVGQWQQSVKAKQAKTTRRGDTRVRTLSVASLAYKTPLKVILCPLCGCGKSRLEDVRSARSSVPWLRSRPKRQTMPPLLSSRNDAMPPQRHSSLPPSDKKRMSRKKSKFLCEWNERSRY